MTIAEAGGRCKAFFARIPSDILVVITLVLASSASFGLGYLTGRDAGQGSGVTIEVVPPADTTAQSISTTEPVPAAAAVPAPAGAVVGQYVASKNGTKYYLPSCASAKRISEANKIWFATIAAATAAGYAPAANCPGL